MKWVIVSRSCSLAEFFNSAARGCLKGGSTNLMQHWNTQIRDCAFEAGLDHNCLSIFLLWLKLCENRELRRIYETKSDEVTKGWRQLYNERRITCTL
jgi:hypothetical protein